MSRVIFILLFLLSTLPLSAQQNLTGFVTDEQNGPLPRASLRIQAGSKMVKFTSSDNDGKFTVILDSLGTDYLLITAYLGKRADTLRLIPGANLTNLTIILTPALESLPSVEVVGDRVTVFNQRDTTVYQTKTYRDSTDRRIEEVLSRIPGVEVFESGEIEVNGKPLYRLLIEDADLFQEDYQLGSKNLRAKDIKSVEVIDHYQENEVLRSVNNSEKIVLNLRLEDDVKATVAGNGIVGGGYGGDEAKVYNHLNAFLIGKRHKFITFLDWNNVGQDNGTTLEPLFPDESDWTASPYNYVEIGDPYQLNLLQLAPKFLDNTNRRLATLRQDSKIGRSWHLSLNLTGTGNRREQTSFFEQELLSDPERFRFSQTNEFTARTATYAVKGAIDYVEPGNKGKLDIYFNAESRNQRGNEAIRQGDRPFSLVAEELAENFYLGGRYTKEVAAGMVAQFSARIGRVNQRYGSNILNRELIELLTGQDSVTTANFNQQLVQSHYGHQVEARLFWNTPKILHEFSLIYEEEIFSQIQQEIGFIDDFSLPATSGSSRFRSTAAAWSGMIKVAKRYKLRLGANGGLIDLKTGIPANFWTYNLDLRLETILKNGGKLRLTGNTGRRLSTFTNANPALFVPSVFTVGQPAAPPATGNFSSVGIHFQRKNDLKFRDFQLSLFARSTENALAPELDFFDQLTLIKNRFDGQRRSLSLRARYEVYLPTTRSNVVVSVQPQYIGFQYRLGEETLAGDYFNTATSLELTVTPLPRLRFKTLQVVNWRRPRNSSQMFIGWRGNGSVTLERKGWSIATETSFARNRNNDRTTFYLTESLWLQLNTGKDSRLRIEGVNLFNRRSFRAVSIDDQFTFVRGVNGPGRFVYFTLDFSF